MHMSGLLDAVMGAATVMTTVTALENDMHYSMHGLFGNAALGDKFHLRLNNDRNSKYQGKATQ